VTTVNEFIAYYNRTMAKPFKCTYQGKALVARNAGLFMPGCTSGSLGTGVAIPSAPFPRGAGFLVRTAMAIITTSDPLGGIALSQGLFDEAREFFAGA